MYSFGFNNPIDTKQLDASTPDLLRKTESNPLIVIEPAVWSDVPPTPEEIKQKNPPFPKNGDGLTLSAYETRIQINVSANINAACTQRAGGVRPRTKYSFTAQPTITDIFGQTLGRTSRIETETPGERQQLRVCGGWGSGLICADTYGGGAFISVQAMNFTRMRMRVHRVEPNQFGDYERYRVRLQHWIHRDSTLMESLMLLIASPSYEAPPPLPGVRATQGENGQIVKLEGFVVDQLFQSTIDLSPYLRKAGEEKSNAPAFGHLLVSIEPVWDDIIDRDSLKYQKRAHSTIQESDVWVQCTGMGVNVVHSAQQPDVGQKSADEKSADNNNRNNGQHIVQVIDLLTHQPISVRIRQSPAADRVCSVLFTCCVVLWCCVAVCYM